jgi:F-type H+-transporting ATPase subunit b
VDIVWNILGGLHFNSTAFFCQVMLFVVFHFCMKAVIYDSLLKTRSAREGQVEGRLSQAKKLADKAHLLKTEYESSLRRIRGDLHAKLQQSIADAEAEAGQQHAAARAEADKILEAAQASLETEMQQLQSQMDAKVAKLGNSIARQVVEQNFSAPAQSNILAKIGG